MDRSKQDEGGEKFLATSCYIYLFRLVFSGEKITEKGRIPIGIRRPFVSVGLTIIQRSIDPLQDELWIISHTQPSLMKSV